MGNGGGCGQGGGLRGVQKRNPKGGASGYSILNESDS